MTATLNVRDVLPYQFHSIFPYPKFNEIQSIVFSHAYQENKNLIVAAPSGSGKTVVMELAICRAFLTFGKAKLKCIYIAPNKALCQQRWIEWSRKFSSLGLSVLELTGDTDVQYYLNQIANASITITTPEKWDCITRCWRNHTFLLCGVNLFLIDEIHHLAEAERGAVLETVIVRMMLVAKTQEKESERMRIIALSATLPNLFDVGSWLKCEPDHMHEFDQTYRPVPLQVKTIAYPNCSNPFFFERSLESKVKNVILQNSDGQPTIIFCPSKKSVESQTLKLAQEKVLRYIIPSNTVAQEIYKIRDENLRSLVLQGYGYHHSGLCPDDRMLVEQLFQSGQIQILCSTSTLAQGMNFPAHLVIIRGTMSWRGSSIGYQKSKKSEIIQMLGRAGRLGFDRAGKAVIMTSKEDEQFYSASTLEADKVESQLQSMLIEGIGAEISQATITSLQDCLAWFRCTLYFVRLVRNADEEGTLSRLEAKCYEICQRALKSLNLQGLVEYDEETGKLIPNNEIHIMSKYLIRFQSMVELLEISKHSDLMQLIRSISECPELHKPLKRTDKKTLNQLMKMIRFPLKDIVRTEADKAYVLLQSAVDTQEIADFSLRAEQAEMVESAVRIVKALRDLSLLRENGKLLEGSTILARSLRFRLWEWSKGNVFTQFPDLARQTVSKMTELGLKRFHSLDGMSLQTFCTSVNCELFEAEKILKYANQMISSQLTFTAEVVDSTLEINLSKMTDSPSCNPLQFELICLNLISGELVCHRVISNTFENSIKIQVPLKNSATIQELKCGLYCNDYVGIDYVLHPRISNETPIQKTPTLRQAPHKEPFYSFKMKKITTSSSEGKKRGIDELNPEKDEKSRKRIPYEPMPSQQTVKNSVQVVQAFNMPINDNHETELLDSVPVAPHSIPAVNKMGFWNPFVTKPIPDPQILPQKFEESNHELSRMQKAEEKFPNNINGSPKSAQQKQSEIYMKSPAYPPTRTHSSFSMHVEDPFELAFL